MATVEDRQERLRELLRRKAAGQAGSANTGAGKTTGEAAATTATVPEEPTIPLLPITHNGTPLDCRDRCERHITASAIVQRYLARISHDRKRPREEEEGAETTTVSGRVRTNPIETTLQDVDDRYEQNSSLGSGVYGHVFMGLDRKSNNARRALKQLKQEWLSVNHVGVPSFLLREIDLLLRLEHPNIVRGLAVGRAEELDTAKPSSSTTTNASTPPSGITGLLFLVTEYAGKSLKSFLSDHLHLGSQNMHPDAPRAFLSRAKCVAHQLLSGLAFLHENAILHRDLKPSNVLVDTSGVIRLCDFGLGRFYRDGCQLTPGVVTLLYRAPEIDLELRQYSAKVDVWSAAIIIAELFLRKHLLYADTEQQHFQAVCNLLGVPDEETNFPGYLLLPHAVTLVKGLKGVPNKAPVNQTLEQLFQRSPFRAARECVSASLIDLLSSVLRWNPKERPDAAALLQHRWFSEEPKACSPAELVTPLPFLATTAAEGSPHTTTTPATQQPLEQVPATESEIDAEAQRESPQEADEIRRRLMMGHYGEKAEDDILPQDTAPSAM